MSKHYFQSLEQLSKGQALALSEVLDKLQFNDSGLIPAVTQDADSKEVLMLAWMNREAIEQTLATRRVTYWSRSRQSLWVKGETSGHIQRLKSMRFDCDGDAILCLAQQTGGACHTGRDNCFYFEVDSDNSVVTLMSSIP